MGVFKKGKKGQKDVWWIDFYYQGQRKRECVGTSKTLAQEALAARKTDIKRGDYGFLLKKKSPRFKDFAQFYLETYSVNKRSCRRDMDIMVHLVKSFGTSRLLQVLPSNVEKYKASRAKVVTKATVNRELSLIRHMFNMAIAEGKAKENPVKAGVRFQIEDKVDRDPLCPEEIQNLLSAAVPHLRPIIFTSLSTGMRLREILYLRWENVALRQGYIRVKNTKAGRDRKIPINVLLHEVLQEQKKTAKGEWVFPSPKTGAPMDSIKTGWQGAVRRSGIGPFRFHDLRHLAASNMVSNGVDLVTVMKILGHSDIRLTQRYSDTSSRAKRDAVETLTWGMTPPGGTTNVLSKSRHHVVTKG